MAAGSDPFSVELVLRGELRSRSRSAILASTASLLLCLTAYLPSVLQDRIAVGTATLLITAWIIRYRNLGKMETMRAALWLRINSTLVLVISWSWAVLLHHLALTYTAPSSVRTIPFVLGLGLVSASAYSLSIRGIDFFDFVIPILGSLLVSFIQVTPDPKVRWVGSLLIFVMFAFLVAQRRAWVRDSLSVQLSNLKLQNLINSFPGGILVSVRRKAIQVNTFFLQALLLPHEKSEDVLGKLLVNPIFRESFENFERSKDLRAEFETPIWTAKGTRAYLFLLDRYLPEREDGIITVGIDIQARKEHERTIETQRVQLEYSAKMKALGEMAGGIAHEINNPLFVILGKAQLSERLLSRRAPNFSLIREHLNTVVQTVERIERITRALLAFARGSSRDPFERVKLKTLLDDTLVLCSSKGQEIHLKIAIGPIPEDLELEVRPAQIVQVLVNLLNNSFDAVEGSKDPWIRLAANLSPNGQSVIISVTDSGPGLDPKIREKVMQPFVTTKPIGKGTGLGLSISTGIVQSHRGSLYFDFESKDTRVVISLPLLQPRENRIFKTKFAV